MCCAASFEMWMNFVSKSSSHHCRFELRVFNRIRSPARSLCFFSSADLTESSSLISMTRQGPITASNGTVSSGAPFLVKWFSPSMCVPACAHISTFDTLQMAPFSMSAKRSMRTDGSVGQWTMPVCRGTEASIQVLFINLLQPSLQINKPRMDTDEHEY